MGDADGQLIDRVGRPVQRDTSAGPVLGSGGRSNGKDDRGGGAGRGAVSPPQWAQLLSGKRMGWRCLFSLFFLPLIPCVYTAEATEEFANTCQAKRGLA